MAELSVIIPFCNEYPQILFTIQSIAQELRDRVDFEIIAVNNYCDEVEKQGRKEDKGYESVKASAEVNPWLRSLHYTDKLSHWQAKNMGVKASSGEFLWFCDAHCGVSRDSVYNMLQYYKNNYEELNGTIHLPLTYKILESHKLIYKLVNNTNNWELGYSFTGYRETDKQSYQVPCMSTCGMMMTRDLYNYIGGWPVELGIYGGGEHFINFVLAVLGKTINIFKHHPLHHHGDKRGYSFNYDDYTRNRAIASYMFGGEKWIRNYLHFRKGNPKINNAILNNVLKTCKNHHDMIREKEVIGIGDWIANRK